MNEWPARPNTTQPITWSNHTHTISFTGSGAAQGSHTWEPAPKETPMTTLQKIVADRKEAKERARLETALAAWDEFEINLLGVGIVGRFNWTPKDKTYTYACIKAGNGWYVTSGSCGGPLDDDGFVTFLVERDVTPADVDWMDPS